MNTTTTKTGEGNAPRKTMTLEEYLFEAYPPVDPGTGKLLPNGQVYYETDGQPIWSVPRVEIKESEEYDQNAHRTLADQMLMEELEERLDQVTAQRDELLAVLKWIRKYPDALTSGFGPDVDRLISKSEQH